MNDTGYVSEMMRNGVCGNESGNSLCSESGAGLDGQAGDKKCIERVNYKRKYSEAYMETRGQN